MDRVIFDTGVLIQVARRRLDVTALVEADADATLPAVVVAEFLHGVYRSIGERRDTYQRFLDDLLTVLPVEDYTVGVAVKHAELLAYTRSSGEPRGSHDLIIAATAAHSSRTIVTTDAAARFSELPGVAARVL